MKKNSTLKNIVVLVIIIMLSFLIELLVFNFRAIFIQSKYRIININNYTIEKKDKRKNINIDVNGKYVNKLKLYYSSKEDIDIDIEYKTKDYYGKNVKRSKVDKLDNEMTLQTTIINSKIKNIKISYDASKKLKINKIYIDNDININILRMVFIFASLLIIYVLMKMYKKDDKYIHRYYFIVGIILGTVLIILQPSTTFYSWDDQIHFKNSYELFGNSFNWTVGEYEMVNNFAVGRGNINSIDEQVNQNKYLNSNKLSAYSTRSGRFITYNQIAYIPSAIGYHVCKLLKLPFIICFKVGKLMNLLVFLLIMSYAIKKAKIGKNVLITIGLLPSTLFLASQYSYDPAVISGISLGMVFLFNWLVDKECKVDFKTLIIFTFSILYACFTKAIYIPLLLLFWLVPSNRFKDKKTELISKIMITIIFTLVMITFALPSSFSADMGGDSRGGNTNASEQFHLVLNNPIGYINVLKDTALASFFEKIAGDITLGGFSYIGKVSSNTYFVALFVLLFSFVFTTDEKKIKIKDKIATMIILLGIILLIWTALYLSFTPVGLNTIEGVQPRYFIPLIFPLLMCFKSDKIKNMLSKKNIYLFIFLAMSSCMMLTIYKLVVLNYCL